jgi:hypothetical protein
LQLAANATASSLTVSSVTAANNSANTCCMKGTKANLVIVEGKGLIYTFQKII